jgi:hypothetical protein
MGLLEAKGHLEATASLLPDIMPHGGVPERPKGAHC